MTTILEQRLEERFFLEGTPYRAQENIGRGAYGVVCKALDTAENRHVAIKKIPRAFTAVTLAKRSLREIRILRDLAHENIVTVLDVFTAPGQRGRDIYVVMDLMETDLHQIIHSRQTLVDQHFQYFVYQILRGLKYLHSIGIVHRDLKPSNVFVNGDCLLKIGDFGMSRSVEQCHITGNYMTQYVSTRWYRAPELLFSLVDYNTKVDIWSAGCIFAEMIMRRQLFPGKDAVSQVKMIVYYLGTPSREVMDRVSSDVVKRWIESCGFKEPLPWNAILPKATPMAIQMIEKLLQVSPWERCSAEEALATPYLATYHDPTTEPTGSHTVFLDVDSIERLQPQQLKEALDEEAQYFESIRGPYNISPSTDRQDEISDEKPVRVSTVSEDIPSTSCPIPPPSPVSLSTPSFHLYRDSSSHDDDSHSNCVTPVVLSSASSNDSVNTVLHVTSAGCLEDDDDEVFDDSQPSTSQESLLENAEKLYPGCSRKGVQWSIPESGMTSAPPNMNPYTSPIGRQYLKNALERRILLKERVLQNALRAATHQNNQKKKRVERKPFDRGRINSDLTSEDRILLERWSKLNKARVQLKKEMRESTEGLESVGKVEGEKTK